MFNVKLHVITRTTSINRAKTSKALKLFAPKRYNRKSNKSLYLCFNLFAILLLLLFPQHNLCTSQAHFRIKQDMLSKDEKLCCYNQPVPKQLTF